MYKKAIRFIAQWYDDKPGWAAVTIVLGICAFVGIFVALIMACEG